MTDHDKIIDKIKKCLALSASSNEHEAAAALRQARALMEKHGLTDLDIQAAEAQERRAESSAKSHPAAWESMLAARIGDAFGCRVVFSNNALRSFFDQPGEWAFIGCGAAPEVAEYAFRVLRRQCKKAREGHIKTRLKRCKTVTKTRRADLFCEGWVRAVAGKITAFAGGEQQATAIDAYLAKHYPSLGNLKTRDRNEGRNLRDYEHDDYAHGHRSGKDAQLNRGVGDADQQAKLTNTL